MAPSSEQPPLRIAFLHKALLYGGAERLILDMALSFREESHQVTIYTCEYDKDKTFPDFQTSKIGINHVGKFIPARIKGKFAALFNLLRMFYLALYLICTWAQFDLVVVDQITLPIPLLRLFKYKVLYYCHFPEALLNDNKRTFVVIIYRTLMDFIESLCLRFASAVCFNSYYTEENVEKIFPSMKKWKGYKKVVYPCMLPPPEKLPTVEHAALLPAKGKYLLSVNRFETRKRIDLCIESFALALKTNVHFKQSGIKLVLAGGLDRNNKDALICRSSLEQLAIRLEISDRVIFRENITQEEKEILLSNAFLFLYTPPNEHFGIGPLESMIRSVPCLAINNGGPKETVNHAETGYLLPLVAQDWSEAILKLFDDKDLYNRLCSQAKSRTWQKFSPKAFGDNFKIILAAIGLDRTSKKSN
jgi:alpha-1,3/alpha-1,6-mannosyltransferase